MSAIRYEWVRVRSVPSTWAGAGAVLALGAGATWVAARTAGTTPESPAEAARLVAGGATVMGPPVTVLAVVIAAALSCARDQHRPALTPLLLAMPRRVGLVVAKAVTAAVLAVVIGAVSLAADAAVAAGTLGADARELGLDAPEARRVLVAYLACLALVAVLGVSVGLIARGAGAAAAALAALPLAVEPLVAQAAQVGLTEPASGWTVYLPFAAADRMLAVSGDGPAPATAALTLGAWTLAALVGAVFVMRGRRT